MNTAKRFLISYFITVVLFLCFDACWLTLTSARIYQPVLARYMAPHYDWSVVGIFYALYFVGITVFVTRPACPPPRYLMTLARGALFGIVAYATYDLTNQAVLDGWPWFLSLIDMAWGGFATGCVSLLTRLLLDKFTKPAAA